MILEIHTNPCRYYFKKKKFNVDDMISIGAFIHTYLRDGGDPRRVHHACPDLELNSDPVVSTKITHDGQEIQRTTISVVIKKEESDDKN